MGFDEGCCRRFSTKMGACGRGRPRYVMATMILWCAVAGLGAALALWLMSAVLHPSVPLASGDLLRTGISAGILAFALAYSHSKRR
jgi:hypothetical protein